MATTTDAPTCLLLAGDIALYLIEDDPLVLQFVSDALTLRPGWRLLGVSTHLAHAMQHAIELQTKVLRDQELRLQAAQQALMNTELRIL